MSRSTFIGPVHVTLLTRGLAKLIKSEYFTNHSATGNDGYSSRTGKYWLYGKLPSWFIDLFSTYWYIIVFFSKTIEITYNSNVCVSYIQKKHPRPWHKALHQYKLSEELLYFTSDINRDNLLYIPRKYVVWKLYGKVLAPCTCTKLCWLAFLYLICNNPLLLIQPVLFPINKCWLLN